MPVLQPMLGLRCHSGFCCTQPGVWPLFTSSQASLPELGRARPHGQVHKEAGRAGQRMWASLSWPTVSQVISTPERGWRVSGSPGSLLRIDGGPSGDRCYCSSTAMLLLPSKEAWRDVSGTACPPLGEVAPEFLSDLKPQAACPDLLYSLSAE